MSPEPEKEMKGKRDKPEKGSPVDRAGGESRRQEVDAAPAGEIRIGAFICNCGTNIAGFLDAKDVSDYARMLPNVVFSRENLFSCSEAGVTDIKNAIKEHKLNRVVVAACTPRTHEPLFRAACEEAGLNKFLFEFVNIREHCSWVHKGERDIATQKAKDLVRMGVARATRLEPKEEITTDVKRTALVIGGGISGLTCALSLARRGFMVTLVEREKELGGLLRYVNVLYPSGVSAGTFVASRIKEVKKSSRIEVLTSSTVQNVKGYIGDYVVSVSSKDRKSRDVNCGVIVVATGANQLVPEGHFGYDGKKVVSQLQLEGMLRQGKLKSKRIVMILCAGARIRERVYCSKICCMTSIKNATLIKKTVPGASVHLLYRDLQCYGVANEEAYLGAKAMGVRFVNYSLENPPVVENGRVRVSSPLSGREMSIETDLVVLASPLVPREGAEVVSRMLKVPLDENKFFLEAHVKLRPMDFATDGIYVCGTAHWPASVSESISQALGAASHASIPLTRGYVKVEPIVSELVDEEACRGCGMCAAVCPYGAVEIVETDKGPKARMIEVACKGCGVCAASCYKRAIGISHYTDEQLDAQVRAYLKGDE
ncbi:MAG: CoB--CoM heterodisulfide reductase iron-sulfur subunit A family protein [Candidatus Eiseniibacteriota bacterium]|nr:MAG: CoB--CoM heterodisulfide reductase iron-sulfur subunit A family protein [Candidatus Eisenbacteria bacterium]